MTTTNDPENYPRRVRAGEIIGHTTPDASARPDAHALPAWQRDALAHRATTSLDQANKAHRLHIRAYQYPALVVAIIGFAVLVIGLLPRMHSTLSTFGWIFITGTAVAALAAAVHLVRTLRDPATRNPVDALRAAAEADCTAAADAHRYVCETVGRLSDDEIDSWISRLTPHRDRLRKISDDDDNPDRPGRTIAPSIRARLDSAATTHAQTLNLLRRELSDRARIDT